MVKYNFDWQEIGGYAEIEMRNKAKIPLRNKAEAAEEQGESSKTVV